MRYYSGGRIKSVLSGQNAERRDYRERRIRLDADTGRCKQRYHVRNLREIPRASGGIRYSGRTGQESGRTDRYRASGYWEKFRRRRMRPAFDRGLYSDRFREKTGTPDRDAFSESLCCAECKRVD